MYVPCLRAIQPREKTLNVIIVSPLLQSYDAVKYQLIQWRRKYAPQKNTVFQMLQSTILFAENQFNCFKITYGISCTSLLNPIVVTK